MELRVVRETDRFVEACRFYGELLGWPVTHGWDAGPDHSGRIYGYGESARVELMAVPVGEAVDVAGVMISVQESDVDALHGQLTEAGATIARPLQDQPWGHRSFGVRDPSGMLIVFFQPIG